MIELIPPVASLVDLVFRMVDARWPTSEDEREVFFDRLGLQLIEDAESEDEQDSSLPTRSFLTLFPDVQGNCSMFRSEFLGLALFAYTEMEDDGPEAKVAFSELKRLLAQRFGAPKEEWGPANQPACLWNPGVLAIDLYCFQRSPSGVMIGVHHAQRSAALDASVNPD